MAAGSEIGAAFTHRQYTFRRKFWKIFGGAFHVYDEAGNVVFYAKQAAFKLREDFKIFADEGMSRELLRIKTPQILDISATYNVLDSATNQPVGSFKRKGIKSIVIDEWTIHSQDGKEIGKLTEKSWVFAILSRFIQFVPQTYVILAAGGKEVAMIKQHFNPWILKYTMTLSEPSPSLDPRLLVTAGILLAAIERRQQQMG